MDFSEQLSNHLAAHPFLLTDNLVTYTDYRHHFENRHECKFTFRLPKQLSPKEIATNFQDKVVQTYFEVVNSGQGSVVVPTSVFQLDVEAHLLVTYNLDDRDKMVCWGALTLKEPKRYIDLMNLFKQFEIKEERRAVGFGSHIGNN